jgi:GNAT superfamily N-acetyltransferase
MGQPGHIRLATYDDLPHFRRLWRQFLGDIHLHYGGLEPCTQNLWFFKDLFTSYTRGSLFGVCVLWEDEEGVPRGITLLGEDTVPSPFKTSFGRVAHLRGVYIEPEHRKQHLAHEILRFAEPHLIELGFNSGQTMIGVGNEVSEQLARSLGGKPFETAWYYPLKPVEPTEPTEGES